MHQDLALAPDLSVVDNMFLGRRVAAQGLGVLVVPSDNTVPPVRPRATSPASAGRASGGRTRSLGN